MKQSCMVHKSIPAPAIIILGLLLGACTPLLEEPSPAIPFEDASLELIACRSENISCKSAFLHAIRETQDYVYCAFYDLDLIDLIKAIEEKDADVKIVLETDNAVALEKPTVLDYNSALMHNKFCVSERTLITGSFNPTINGEFFNDNVIVISNSSYLRQNYLTEFSQLYDTKIRKTPYPLVNLSGILVENYFCPQDGCEEHVLAALNESKKSIRFLTFSFTSDPIGDLLARKQEEGIVIEGVFEKRSNSRYSEYQSLEDAGASVYFDGNPKTMHHKLFIIDAKTVIVGSYNPTKSADERNNENLLIIHDPQIASIANQEFNRVWQVSRSANAGKTHEAAGTDETDGKEDVEDDRGAA